MADPIDVQELAQQLAENPRITVLDVGRKADFEQSPQRIRGARWYDPEAIGEWLDAVPKDREVVVYCVKGGAVSQSVTERLAGQGCLVKYLEGGIKAWSEEGGPLE